MQDVNRLKLVLVEHKKTSKWDARKLLWQQNVIITNYGKQ